MNRAKKIFLKVVETIRPMSWLLRIGLVVFILAGALDLSYHIYSSFWPGRLDPYLGPDGYYTHLAVFSGMLLIIIGVIRTHPQPENQVEISTLEDTSIRR